MRSAREMFGDLGYEEVEVDSDNPKQYIRFTKSGGPVDISIDFDVKYKQISAYEFDWYYHDTCSYAVDIQEHKAINQMCKELGWL